MNIRKLKNYLCDIIDENCDKIVNIAKELEKTPELGFKEHITTSTITRFLKELGYNTEENIAETGVKAKLKESGCFSPNIAVMGEIDAITCHENSLADPLTGAAHVCGHHLQAAIMLGVALALKLSDAEKMLDGNVTFIGVPAEEYVEIAYRTKLLEEKKLHFLGGKQELIYRGYFDDIDMSIITHAEANTPEKALNVADWCNGFITKTVRYLGKIAHAGCNPENGINALNAALVGLNAVNALRETFPDEDHIRVHPIITKGGDSVNVIPADVRLELYVRGRTMECIEKVSDSVDNALRAGGLAVGAETIIKTMPGYLPLSSSQEMNEILLHNAYSLIPKENTKHISYLASGDIGDLSHLMPTIQVTTGGVDGIPHSKEFHVADYYSAVIIPAKAIAMTLVDFLHKDSSKAKLIIKNFKPIFSKEEYLNKMSGLFS
jgi:amidohydrolase